MANLPDDVITNILLRLPAKSLVRFRCVSRSWKSLISDSSFIRSYLDRSFRYGENVLLKYDINRSSRLRVWPLSHHEFSSVDPTFQPSLDRFELNGSCNGVICLSTYSRIDPNDSKIYLWNPSINELTVVPESNFQGSNLIGFGYNPSSGHLNDFKVVNFNTRANFGALFSPNFGDLSLLSGSSEVEVYSLRTNTWKQTGRFFPSGYEKYMGRQVLFREYICWCPLTFTGTLNTWSLLLFDVINEVFDEKSPPKSILWNDQCITTLEGCLSIFAYNYRKDYEVWVMKEFGDVDSWTKLYTIELPGMLVTNYLPLGFAGKDEVLFVKIDTLSHRKARTLLASYNTGSMLFQESNLHVDSFLNCCLVSYVESLVSVSPGNEAAGPSS